MLIGSISLLYIPAKCLERIIHSAIHNHDKPFLSDCQHGFIKGRSCSTQQVLTYHQWAKALDEGRQTDVVFLDHSKAFDKAHHNIMLHKLCSFGISGSLLIGVQIIFLIDSSVWLLMVIIHLGHQLRQGLPKALFWALSFFVTSISDLPDCVCSVNTIALYADDCKTSRIIDNSRDQTLFQHDLDKLAIGVD